MDDASGCHCTGPQLGLVSRRQPLPAFRPALARSASPATQRAPLPALPTRGGGSPPGLRIPSRGVPSSTGRGLAIGSGGMPPGLARGLAGRGIVSGGAREPLKSTSPVERTAAAVSEAAPVTTERLRSIAAAMGAPPEVTRSPSRRLLVQALGIDAVAQAGGIDTPELMRRASVAPQEIMRASLHLPDAALLVPDVMRVVGWRSSRYPAGGWFPTAQGLGSVDIFPESGGSQDGFTTPNEQPWSGSGDTGGDQPGSGSATGQPLDIPKTPGAVPFRAGNWDFREGTYTLAQGDTLCGLGITYLGGMCARGITDIWPLQEFRFSKCPSPTPPSYTKCADGRPVPAPGTRFRMPQEAIDRAKRWYDEGHPGAPATPGAPGYGNDAPGSPDKKPSPKKPGGGSQSSASSFIDKYKWPLLGAGVVAVAAVALT